MKPQHSSGKNKACIVLYCLDNQHIPDQNRWVLRMEYNICIVDLKSDIAGIVDVDDGFTLVSPTFQINCGTYDEQNPYNRDAFCVLGQTLYMFEGSSHKERKSVFALDLTRTRTRTLTQRTTKLAREDGPLLKKIGDMTLPKPRPAALPTPQGNKIVVFCESQCTFELFEPASRSWERLPSIARRGRACAYGFVQGNKLLVQMDSYSSSGERMYALDLDDDKHWVRLGSIYSGVGYIPHGCSFFEMVGEGRFCFVNSSGFYDVEEYAGEYDDDDHYSLGFVPRPPERAEEDYDDDSDFLGEYYAALLNYNGDLKGECDFCHMEIVSWNSEKFVQSCRAAINVCRVDLKSYAEMADRLSLEDLRWADKLRRSKTKTVKTLRFSLWFEGRRKFYERHLLFTF